MYPHPKFIVKEKSIIQELVKLFPLATLIYAEKDEIHISHLPLVWKNDFLLGHIDLQNPLANKLQQKHKIKVIFHGPENYISPGHFDTAEFPTYNFMKVEINATVSKMNKDELRESIFEMTHLLDYEFPNNLEGKEERLEKTMDYIHGFKLKILTLEGRFKMSQDKSKVHFDKAINLLQNGASKRNVELLKKFREFENQKK